METFGQRLRALRKGIAKKQHELSSIFGVNAQTWGNYERDRNQPEFELIGRICSHFGINSEWLIFGNEPKFTNEKLLAQKSDYAPPCPACAVLERTLAQERQERLELGRENKELLRENGELKAEIAQLKERLRAVNRGGEEYRQPGEPDVASR